MAQYFYDFSSDSIGSAPAGFTPFGFGGTSWTGNVTDVDPGAPVLKAVRFNDNGQGAVNVGYTQTALGTYAPGGSETIEMVCCFKIPAGQAAYAFGLRWGNYYFGPNGASLWAMQWDFNWDFVNGTTSTSHTVTADTWWWVRVQRSGAGVFKMRAWQDGTTEPSGSWLITSTADTHYTSGAFGFWAYDYTHEPDVRAFGIGTNGDAAPTTSGGPPPVTPVLMGQIVM